MSTTGTEHPTVERYSALRPQKRLDLAEASPLPHPFTLYVEPTNICNFRCVYCPESFDNFKEETGGMHKLDAETFEKIAAQIKELCGERGLKRLFFHMMGEPFVNKQLMEIVRIATRENLADKTFITTNGSVITEKIARQIVGSGLDYLRLSVYGTNQEQFAARTQSGIDFNKIVENMHRLRAIRDAESLDKKPFIYVKMINSGDAAENQRFHELFAPVADEIALEDVMNWNEEQEKGLSQIDEEKMLSQHMFRHQKKHACSFPFFSLVIHADLQVSVCCVDWAKKTVVGSLRHNTLREIWEGDLLREFRLLQLANRRHEIEACKGCTFLYTHPDNVDALTPEEYARRTPNAPKVFTNSATKFGKITE